MKSLIIATALAVLSSSALAQSLPKWPPSQPRDNLGAFWQGVRSARVPSGGWCDRACILRLRKAGECMAPDTLWSEARPNTLSFSGGRAPGLWPAADRERCAP